MQATNNICDLFGIEVPIVQAPMAGFSTTEMAIAVSSAGGLGSLGCAAASLQELRERLVEYRAATDAPVLVNFFAGNTMPDAPELEAAWLEKLAPYFLEFDLALPQKSATSGLGVFDEARVEILEEFVPEVVSFHFGLPSANLVSRLKSAGCKVISTATTVREAIWLEEKGCDAIIAQGLEAGGHRGQFLEGSSNLQLGSFALIPQISDAISIPVIAAGGIGDARGVAAACALGASAVQVGTAYLFTEEAAVSPVYLKTIAVSGQSGTAVSNIFSGRPARVVVNRLFREQGPMSNSVPPFPKPAALTSKLRGASEKQESADMGAYYCGQSAPLCNRTSASQLTRDLAAGILR